MPRRNSEWTTYIAYGCYGATRSEFKPTKRPEMRHALGLLAMGFAFAVLDFALTAPALAGPVDIEDARAMVFDKGIVKIDEIELDDGIWEIEGYDQSGQEIEMGVDAASGAIVKLKRD